MYYICPYSISYVSFLKHVDSGFLADAFDVVSNYSKKHVGLF